MRELPAPVPADLHDEPPAAPPRPSWRWFAALLLSAGLALVIGISLTRSNHIPPDLAGFIVEKVLRAVPAEDGVAWRPESLPVSCADQVGPLKESLRCSIALKIPFVHDPDDSRPWSAYLPYFQGEVTVSLNGTFLSSSAWEQSSADPFAFAPMIVALPAPLLRAGDNVLDVTVEKYGPVSGFLDRIAIGPLAQLRPNAQWRHFLSVSLPGLLNGWQFAMGLSAVVIWLTRSREDVYLLFGCISLFHAGSSLPTALGGIIDDPWLVLFLHNGRLVAGSLVYPFITSLLLGRPTRIPLVVFLSVPVLNILSHFILPLDLYLRILVLAFYPVVIVMMVAAFVVVAIQALTRWNVAAAILIGGIVVALTLGSHDLMTVYLKRDLSQAMLGRYTGPAFMIVIGAMLIWRFARVMNALDRVNARITKAVASAQESLRLSFAREQEQTRARILEAERMRLMSDLHDGIAGQLVSILARCELRNDPREEIAHSVRAALTDLRLVVASLEDSGDDLAVMLALFRERIEPQLSAMGVRLTWRMVPLPGVAGLHPSANLNIFRILQEAAINAARHSGSVTLDFEAVPSPMPGQSVRLTLRDHGRGGAERRAGSYGLDNMHRRAEALRANLQIVSDSTGTTAILDLPPAV